MTNKKTDTNISRKHIASPYYVERLFIGTRTAGDIVADLVKVHCS